MSSYDPNCENSIDEAMIKFKGRSSLKQYVPLKPIKRGIKAWVRADARNGIMCELSVYTGKEGDQPETNLGANVVKKLTITTSTVTTILHQSHYLTSFWKMTQPMHGVPSDEIAREYLKTSKMLVSLCLCI